MKLAILICTWSGACPSMAKINFWDLAERIRLEVPHDYMALHPRLCEDNGEVLMENLLKPDTVYITVACNEKKQAKLLANGFARAKVSMDSRHWIPISLASKDTDQVFEEIKAAVSQIGNATQ